ncbi:hypothetical protein QVD17_03387 [Tagetes erecta]|uniref:Uncharacterized protein n=1 Tax=Tagetes erecta TaxID=13708 RepID=A0AAD8LAW1_TARER|nr:hypothetical protein QVD17_03387 [Tagetes erecta]
MIVFRILSQTRLLLMVRHMAACAREGLVLNRIQELTCEDIKKRTGHDLHRRVQDHIRILMISHRSSEVRLISTNNIDIRCLISEVMVALWWLFDELDEEYNELWWFVVMRDAFLVN